jgi:hypothetical protein
MDFRLHGATIKTINAQQAKLCTNYKDTKLKLLKTNAAIWFNKMYRIKQLKPNYINIKINGRKPQDKKTTSNAIRYRINQQIKSLHHKKQNPNRRLYHIHLENAQQCKGMWQHIQNSIDSQINGVLDNLYQKLNKKLYTLTKQTQTQTNTNTNTTIKINNKN